MSAEVVALLARRVEAGEHERLAGVHLWEVQPPLRRVMPEDGHAPGSMKPARLCGNEAVAGRAARVAQGQWPLLHGAVGRTPHVDDRESLAHGSSDVLVGSEAREHLFYAFGARLHRVVVVGLNDGAIDAASGSARHAGRAMRVVEDQ